MENQVESLSISLGTQMPWIEIMWRLEKSPIVFQYFFLTPQYVYSFKVSTGKTSEQVK